MTRLLLVRHGRSELNAVGRVQGWLDSPLDELGRAQSLAVARRLERESPVIVYTSTLRRASETAEIIGAELGLAVVPDERLIERGMGDIAGLSGDEIESRFPELIEEWRHSSRMVVPPGGEAVETFGARVRAVLGEIVERHAGQPVVVVTHGGVLAIYMGQLLGVETGRWAPFSFGNGSLSIVEFNEGGARVLGLNERCHLEGVS